MILWRVSLDLWIQEYIEPVQSRIKQSSRVFSVERVSLVVFAFLLGGTVVFLTAFALGALVLGMETALLVAVTFFGAALLLMVLALVAATFLAGEDLVARVVDDLVALGILNVLFVGLFAFVTIFWEESAFKALAKTDR